MAKRPQPIYNIRGLSEAIGLARSRVDILIKEGRLIPDYRDSSGVPYWNEKSIQKYREALTQSAKKGQPRQFD